MLVRSKPLVTLAVFGLVFFGSAIGVGAQTIYFSVFNVALKNGESIQLGDVYYISTECRSLLTGTPEVEIMDGPPGVEVTVKKAMVVPRSVGCAKEIPGGKIMISANDIEDYSHTRMVVRIKYPTKSGDILRSRHINVTLFP
jgi:hypothetical protein